jgi:L-threonylcarbamoyladenylate synthase
MKSRSRDGVLSEVRSKDIERAVVVLRNGGIVAYPTDTLYGLAVDPRLADAVRRLFAVKGREHGHAVPLIAADVRQAEDAAVFDDCARRVAAMFWPGPLSLVLPARETICTDIAASDGSVAVRVAAHPIAHALAAGLGFCITATSANLTGRAPTSSPAVVSAALGDRVDFVLDGGKSPGGPPSTIVDLRGPQPLLVRHGAIAWDRVLRSIE